MASLKITICPSTSDSGEGTSKVTVTPQPPPVEQNMMEKMTAEMEKMMGSMSGGEDKMQAMQDDMMKQMRAQMGSSDGKSMSYASSSSYSSKSSKSYSSVTSSDGATKVVEKETSSSDVKSKECTNKDGQISETSTSEAVDEQADSETTADASGVVETLSSSAKDVTAQAEVSHTTRDGDKHTKGEKYTYSERSVPTGNVGENTIESTESSTTYESLPPGEVQGKLTNESGKVTVVIPMNK